MCSNIEQQRTKNQPAEADKKDNVEAHVLLIWKCQCLIGITLST